jgi:hypothetical protein
MQETLMTKRQKADIINDDPIEELTEVYSEI